MNKLQEICLLTGIVLMMFLAMLCIIGSAMGTDWSMWFFSSPAGRWLWISIGLLIIAALLQFKEIYTAKWPLAVYSGILLILAGSFANCDYTIFAGFAICCIGLFGLFWVKWSRIDIIIAILVLGLVLYIFLTSKSSYRFKSVFFVPHLFACLLSYIFFIKAALFAGKYLIDKNPQTENNSYKYVCIGFAFLTVGIAVGSVWAAFAWDNWWSWDPKETFSLAVWLVFAAFLHFRYLYKQRFPRLNSIWIITGFILIVAGVSLVNFSKIFAGLHSHI